MSPIGDFPNPQAPLGWQCPVCQRVWAPSFPGPCVCANKEITITPHTGTPWPYGSVTSTRYTHLVRDTDL